MRNVLSALVTGTLFGGGLALSDMINPARVLAFLDVAGEWDPTLGFVLAAALLPSATAYLLVRSMRRPRRRLQPARWRGTRAARLEGRGGRGSAARPCLRLHSRRAG